MKLVIFSITIILLQYCSAGVDWQNQHRRQTVTAHVQGDVRLPEAGPIPSSSSVKQKDFNDMK